MYKLLSFWSFCAIFFHLLSLLSLLSCSGVTSRGVILDQFVEGKVSWDFSDWHRNDVAIISSRRTVRWSSGRCDEHVAYLQSTKRELSLLSIEKQTRANGDVGVLPSSIQDVTAVKAIQRETACVWTFGVLYVRLQDRSYICITYRATGRKPPTDFQGRPKLRYININKRKGNAKFAPAVHLIGEWRKKIILPKPGAIAFTDASQTRHFSCNTFSCVATRRFFDIRRFIRYL